MMNKPMNCLAPTPMMKTTPAPSTTLPDPAQDGFSHINVHYNVSTTKIGRMLSTYFVVAFKHPYFGPFKCIEGFMRYVQTGCCDDAFRRMTGAQAKAHFRKKIEEGKLTIYAVANEAAILQSALYAKLEHNPVIATLFTESTLPFDHYYLYESSRLPIRPDEGAMLTNSLTELRALMQVGQKPEPISDAEYARLIVR